VEDDGKFKFLSIFKWEKRKGWDFLIKSYLSEFKGNENVALYILTHGYHEGKDKSPQKQYENLLQTLDLPILKPSIHIIDKHIPDYDMPRFYRSFDAVVIPSRGEGWGRPHVEAMSMELPLIATYWSGPTEYMNEDNSYPLNIRGLELVGEGPFSTHEWALPDVVHLKSLMRRVFTHPQEAIEKGKKARQDMITKYHPNIIAEQIKKILEEIKKTKINLYHEDL